MEVSIGPDECLSSGTPYRRSTRIVFMGLNRGEGALTAVVFILVYAGVMLPRLGEYLGVFFASRPEPTPPPRDGDPRR
jgi:hypothetical protein